MTEKNNIGENIKIYREKYHLTQTDLGREIDVYPQTVLLWEKGVKYPNKTSFYRLCNLFHTSVPELMQEPDYPTQEELSKNISVHDVSKMSANLNNLNLQKVYDYARGLILEQNNDD